MVEIKHQKQKVTIKKRPKIRWMRQPNAMLSMKNVFPFLFSGAMKIFCPY